ncbi:serine hydrolase domain-containing protein [Geomicrobium sp. JSM 1781026]|uniref:serine hydrolase domain-containing protein n=1 Tax=Geomicrobium sp. JSM 1781026 TaxID=3344580 RepID=UPI0035BF0E71
MNIRKALATLAAGASVAIVGYKAIQNWKAATLFSEHSRIERFQHMNEVMPSNLVKTSETPSQAFENATTQVNKSYLYKGKEQTLDHFLNKTTTTGFIVIKDNQILLEEYLHGSDEHTRFTSWSVAKSMVSALIGIAVDEGKIQSIQDPVDQYVPELANSAYRNVPIEHVLLMASGVRFNEDYSHPLSDIRKLFYSTLVFNQSIDNYVQSLSSNRLSGTMYRYASVDTQVLGMVLREATGVQPSEYFSQKIWKKIDAERDGYWNTDRKGNDLSFCGFSATLRDYARFGQLYLQQGKWNEEQIIPADWVSASTQIGDTSLRKQPSLGYQYQWWIPHQENKDYLAMGVWGQFIYVHPEKQTVIVKTSVDPDFEKHEKETIEVFRHLAENI